MTMLLTPLVLVSVSGVLLVSGLPTRVLTEL